MAHTATLPPPSLMLRSPDSAPLLLATGSRTAPPPLSAADQGLKASQTAGVAKRKQSKSRNGCVTCKAKRLKCDETKPTCQQCARRAVTCGGYKKNFQWRPFEEPNAPAKKAAKARKDSGQQTSIPVPSTQPLQHSFPEHQYSFTASASDVHLYAHPPPSQFPYQQAHGLQPPFIPATYAPNYAYCASQPPPFLITPEFASPAVPYALSSGASQGLFQTSGIEARQSETSSTSGQSPKLIELLREGTDLNATPPEYRDFIEQHAEIYSPPTLTPPVPLDDEVEEIPRRDPESSPSSSSSDSSRLTLSMEPVFCVTSPENLTRRFDRDTCGVLSVKDGPTENPWRTLVWPLARDCPALYHAIASMTSFHQSKEMPAMRIQGIDHMRNAVHALGVGLQNMRFDAAISTSLVLAFSESWDQQISTGIDHIKGAKLLINKALVQHRHTPKQGDEWTRLRFLCNTWIYMDVISRLTSADDDETNDVDAVHESICTVGANDSTLDPLMGCANALFPIIGRVANLVRKVRKATSNGPDIISQAIRLKSQLESWQPPSHIEDPEDETTSPHDSISTAVAYQYATLLYLHQAVPEMPSLSSIALAKRVIQELSTVKPGSRSTIIHIYPLTAAGCEAIEQKDRDWVLGRWASLLSRMKLGILDKCLDVTKEVWNRRDAFANEHAIFQELNHGYINSAQQKRTFDNFMDDVQADNICSWLDDGSKRRALDTTVQHCASVPGLTMREAATSTSRPFASIEPELLPYEFTVKGRLHWLGVMRDWSWEVLLG